MSQREALGLAAPARMTSRVSAPCRPSSTRTTRWRSATRPSRSRSAAPTPFHFRQDVRTTLSQGGLTHAGSIRASKDGSFSGGSVTTAVGLDARATLAFTGSQVQLYWTNGFSSCASQSKSHIDGQAPGFSSPSTASARKCPARLAPSSTTASPTLRRSSIRPSNTRSRCKSCRARSRQRQIVRAR